MSIQRNRIRVPILAVALLSGSLGLFALSALGPFQLFTPSADAVLTLSVRDVADEKNIILVLLGIVLILGGAVAGLLFVRQRQW